jgi:hypothetical protein
MALIELLKPVSWNPNVSELPSGSWAGLISNVDEPFTSPDGSTISCSTASVACEIDFSDVVFIRNGIDEILTVVPQIRMRSDTPLTVYMYLRKYGNVLSYQDLFVLGDNVFRNWSIYKTSWHGAFAGTDANALDSIQMNLIVFNAEPWNLQVDTIGIQVQYQNPLGIETKPGEGLLGIDTGPPTRLVRNYARPSLGTIQFVPKDVEFFRQEIERPDNYYLILEQSLPVLNSTYFPGKATLTLAGTLQSYYGIPTDDGALTLAGKAPDDIDQTENQRITVPDSYTSHLLLSGQNVGDEDTVMPDRLRATLSGKVPTAERSWKSTPDTASLNVDIPPSPERIWPESWAPNGWLGNIEDIDEPLDEADGLVIYTNQPSLICTIDFSDVQDIRDGVDTITGLLPLFRIWASAATKLYYYIYVEDTFRASGTLSTSGGVFTNFILPDFLWGPFVAGTDTGPINSFQMRLAIFDSGVTVDVDVISLYVIYDRVMTTNPLLGEAIIPTKGTLSLQGKVPTALNTTDAVPSGSVSLSGEQPLLFRSLILNLSGKGIALDAALPVPGTALAFTGKAPIIRSIIPDAATLSLTGKRPAFVFGTVIPPGDHGIISLSTRYDIEHIATPTDELEF